MVRTVKVIGVLSANERKATVCEENKSPESHKKCRYVIRVARRDSRFVQEVSDAKRISITPNERATQGISDQRNPAGNVKNSASTGVKIIGTLAGSPSRKSGPASSPQKKRKAIVSVQNGSQGMIKSNVRQSTFALTSSNDAHKISDENMHTDGSKESCQCYPPSEHTAQLLKLLSSGEILSYKELDDIISYIGYLKSRKLVTDHLLKKKIISLITEPQHAKPDILDDEPPIVTSKVMIPFLSPKRRASSPQDSIPALSPKRRASPPEDSVPPKMPRLLEVLRSNDFPQGVPQMIESKHISLPLSRETHVSCEMCGSRVQFTHLKMHNKICKGVLIRRPRHAPTGSPSNPEEERRTRTCPRCGKKLPCDSDFEMHMAVAHKFYWRLEFDKEDEFKAWFREEGLDETMYVATCKTSPNLQQKVYYCAINRNQASNVKKCPCRLVVKKMPTGIIVRYLILHNHTERFVRRVMSSECRDIIVKLLKEGHSNYEILKRVKETYPKTSMNYYITRESITRLRHRYCRKTKTAKPKRKARRAKKAFDVETDPQFSDDKQSEAWGLPELRITDTNDCSVIEPANF